MSESSALKSHQGADNICAAGLWFHGVKGSFWGRLGHSLYMVRSSHCPPLTISTFTHARFSYKLPRVLAFTALALSSISAAPFFSGFMRHVFIEGATVSDLLMSELLASSGPLGRHSRVILLEGTTQDYVISCGDAMTGDLDKARHKRAWAEFYKLTVSEYIWDHPRISPYGNRVPMQCDTCLRLGTFVFFDHKGTSPQTHCYRCKHCHAEWSFEPPQDGRLLKEFNEGYSAVV
ncbi:hypothetical protein BKA93DRAFT_750688 [Sparassis latifolia]